MNAMCSASNIDANFVKLAALCEGKLFAKNTKRPDFKSFVLAQKEADLARVAFCSQMGSAFVILNKMEDAIIGAMATCDRIKVTSVLKEDAEKWEEMLEKHSKLLESTLGNLIKILSKHPILQDDLNYLGWLKSKRDFFIHRFFREGNWPGNLDPRECEFYIRRARYFEIIFNRASVRIWKIFARAGLFILYDLGADGVLLMNPDMFAPDIEEESGG
ncbi:hypothetical protein [Afipia carboxidovorans]|nr:hypothetical protein [Afipia carboxidovorans]